MSDNNKKMHMWKEQIIQFVLFLPFFTPNSVDIFNPLIERILDMYLLVSCLLILLFYLFVYRKVSRLIIAIMVFEMAQVFSTVINSGDYWRAIVFAGNVICFCMLIEISIERDARSLLRTFMTILGVLCFANLISILLYPNGMYTTLFTNNWILGYDNVHVLYILPFLCVFALYTAESHFSNILKWIVFLLSSLSIYITWSATSVVGVTVWLAFFAMSNLNILRKIITNFKVEIIGSITFFFTIVIFRVQDLFSYIIERILQKSLTFTGRTRIWDSALNLFQKSPIYGHGVMSTDVVRSYLIGAAHCHNYFLQILFQSGIIGMVCFLVILLLLIKPKKHSHNGKITYLIYLTVFCFLIMLQFEAYIYITTFFGIMTMAYHSDDLENGLSGISKKNIMLVWKRKR